jgi:hypothetical protein
MAGSAQPVGQLLGHHLGAGTLGEQQVGDQDVQRRAPLGRQGTYGAASKFLAP